MVLNNLIFKIRCIGNGLNKIRDKSIIFITVRGAQEQNPVKYGTYGL
jgi:hypothetical protein